MLIVVCCFALLGVRCLVFVACRPLFVVCCLCVVCRWFFAIGYCYSLCVVRCFLCVVCLYVVF